ncbi:hypothetical protein JR316_0006704 [Psilocybe cubensis]|uniref:Uncharacterized protein n=1 Tax=Psilocybe cubensis TaxID=181762 RepID=A0ACB8GXE4_PSICU|nr:hypothetical protein JR316_0006704 [Psilocybe cubensis]KAH9480107.1 hypothetical protein JR316_0006704 [Psilocybe cubensis]
MHGIRCIAQHCLGVETIRSSPAIEAIAAANIRLETATAAWHRIHKKRRENRPANWEDIHKEFKDAKESLTALLKDRKSKEINQETLDSVSNLETTAGFMSTSSATSYLAAIVASTISKVPLAPVEQTTGAPATILQPKTWDRTIIDENQVEETMPAEKEPVTGPPRKDDEPCAPTNSVVYKGPVTESAIKSTVDDANIDPVLKALSLPSQSADTSIRHEMTIEISGFPAGVVNAATPPHQDLISGDARPIQIDSGRREALGSNGEAPILNDCIVTNMDSFGIQIVGGSTMFPIPPNLQKELDQCTAESSGLLQKIHTLEEELCAPAQRTMDEIRLKLREIDSGYAAIYAVEKRVSEIQNIIAEGERSFTANERRKHLLKRKEILDKQRDEGEAEFSRLTVADLPEYQRKRNLLMAEIDAVKLELQQLASSKSKKASKGTTIRSKFAKASRQARITKSSGGDKAFSRANTTENGSGDDDESSLSEGSFEGDGEGSKSSKRKSSTKFDPTIGRKRTKAQRLMLEVVYSDELKEEEEANATGLREFRVDEWDCEEDMKEEANWAAMTPIQRVEYCDDIVRSIARFQKTGNLQDFRPKYRRSLRHVQSLLPEKCFESRRVAIAIHMTSHGNLICRFHKRYPKTKFFDNGPGLYRVRGVPKKPVYRYRVEDAATPLRETGYMSCGCLIDDVLLEFYFWKTLTISSPLPSLQGLEEPMKGDVFEPRHRSFLIKVFKEQSLLTADDIYDPNRPRDIRKFEREVRLLDLSITRLAKKWEEKTGIEMRIIFPQREAELERMRREAAEAATKQGQAGESSAMSQ